VKVKFIWILLLFGYCSVAQNLQIEGKLDLDSTWANEIFLCEVPSFQQLYTASNQLIVAGANIREDGTFILKYESDSNQERLYRIQIHKKLDPVSTITIGGPDENHFFVHAKNGDLLNLNSNSPSGSAPFRKCEIKGSKENTLVGEIIDLASNQTELEREDIKERLIEISSETDSECIALFAAYNVFGLNDSQQEHLNEILLALPGKSIYAEPLSYTNTPNTKWWVFILILCVLIVIYFWKARPEIKRRLDQKKIYSKLSSQEMKVMGMVVNGLSNKEIASHLYIELSTVKSHVNSIYSKLNLTTRKETHKYRSFFESLE
jgi:DNA-binding CsgD family transcriptional regulator